MKVLKLDQTTRQDGSQQARFLYLISVSYLSSFYLEKNKNLETLVISDGIEVTSCREVLDIETNEFRKNFKLT
jgi:hypothetical protein